jgi:hypothetical protein
MLSLGKLDPELKRNLSCFLFFSEDDDETETESKDLNDQTQA